MPVGQEGAAEPRHSLQLEHLNLVEDMVHHLHQVAFAVVVGVEPAETLEPGADDSGHVFMLRPSGRMSGVLQ